MKYLGIVLILVILGFMIFLTYGVRTLEDADRIIMLKKTPIKIDDIHVAKYSTVYGSFEYNGKTYRIFSIPNDGYYYKHYNLEKGDTITADVMLYMYDTRDTVDVEIGAMDLKKYEIN